MRMMLVGIAGLAGMGLGACVYDPSHYPEGRPVPQPTQTSNSGIILPGHVDKIPDTPYEVRKAEIERDRQIAGQSGPTYPPLFKNQKDDKDPGGQ
ncbi:MAG: hypothetical protein QM773_03525 [Hyphomonadaceae bacterium]